MKIRKIICALTTAVMIASVSSCGCVSSTPDAEADTTTTTATSQVTEDTTTNADTEVMDPADDIVPEDTIISDETTPDISTEEQIDEAAYASSYINTSKIGWGLGKERDSLNRPLDALNAEEKYADYNARFLTTEGKICLTFDEGYENGYTSEILDVLKEKNVKAVFFVTYDYCKSSPELVKRMIAEGHTVGNHSYTHPSFPDLSEKEMIDEIMALHDYAVENFGYEMTLFRFPKGEFSEKALSVVKNLGYTSVFWSFAYNDWDTNSQPDKTEASEKIKTSTHSGIYLLHAVSETNAAILGGIIDYWISEGYTVGADLN